jgi:hypothetical protein
MKSVMNSKEKIREFLRSQTTSYDPRSDKDNLIILESNGKITELSFEEFLRFQKNTLLDSSEYMVIRGNILKTYRDSGHKLLTKLDLYKKK